MTKTVHCPKCDSTNIREANEAYTDLPVLEWDFDFDDPRALVAPASYDTDNDPEWATVTDGDPYNCGDCNWEGEIDELIVKDAAPEETR